MSKAKYDGIAYEYNGLDYLDRNECSDMRKFHKHMCSCGWCPLAGCGYRARFKYMDDGTIVLMSYGTNVLRYNPATLSIQRLWDGYSKTTMKHVLAFCWTLNIHATISSKRAWSNLPVCQWMRL